MNEIFLAFSVDRIVQVVDFSTSELDVASLNPVENVKCKQNNIDIIINVVLFTFDIFNMKGDTEINEWEFS